MQGDPSHRRIFRTMLLLAGSLGSDHHQLHHRTRRRDLPLSFPSPYYSGNSFDSFAGSRCGILSAPCHVSMPPLVAVGTQGRFTEEPRKVSVRANASTASAKPISPLPTMPNTTTQRPPAKQQQSRNVFTGLRARLVRPKHRMDWPKRPVNFISRWVGSDCFQYDRKGQPA